MQRIDTEPRYATIPTWCSISGMSRAGTYNALGRRDLRAVKLGLRTLIDVRAGLEWLGSLPEAQVQRPKSATPQPG